MLRRIVPTSLWELAAFAALVSWPLAAGAQDPTPPANRASNSTSPSVSQPPVPLTLGVADVLNLSQSQVDDDVIVSYIKSSGRSYGGISASEILYLREQGVSDRVVTAMLDQSKQLAQGAAQTTPPTQVAPAPAPAEAIASTAPNAPAYAPPPVTYTQPAPASTVYVIPDSPSIVSYGYYPGYYPGYGYYGCYPSVSFSFGFGGGYHYYGGGHGWGYHGGGHGGHHR